MLSNYPKAQELIDHTSRNFQNIFGKNLLAIYVTGSLSTDSYREGLSDIDIIAVTENKVSGDELTALKEWVASLEKQQVLALDISFVDKKNLRFDSIEKDPALELFQGAFDYAQNALGNSPIIWDQILKSGITVFGPEPKELIDEVPWKEIEKALQTELLSMQEKIETIFEDIKFRYYVATTLCRMTYTIAHKSYASKEQALQWYKNTHGLHQQMIDAAIAYIEGDKSLMKKTEQADYRSFISEVLSSLLH